jgi:hypothetical protein
MHCDGLSHWWIETTDGIKVAEFGCGPTSEKNALFYAMAHNHLPDVLAQSEQDKIFIEDCLARLESQQAEIEKLRAALEFYRDERNWLTKPGLPCSAIIADTGARAKAALGESK